MHKDSLVIFSGDLRLLIERGEKMYIVSSLDIRGLNTQGRTIEEAIANAHDAAKLLAEDRAEMTNEVAAAKKKARSRPAKSGTAAKRTSRRTVANCERGSK